MMKLAVFASGSGTNFQAIIDAVEDGRLQAELVLLVCDKPEAKAIERANTHQIPTFVFQPKQYSNKEAFELEILAQLQNCNVDYIALAGYMRLIGPTLLQAFEGRIINIHPSLLPAFPGKDAIGQAFQAKVSETGVTIHYVDEGMDTGPIIAQGKIQVDKEDTIEAVTKKIQKVEHELYPATLQKLFSEKVGRELNDDN
ncbi:phosphoribosylglycinamide formyltransferase [Alkalihalobacillus sp. LMS39]|uniref:phosphoribosylglycinamide formyltransferase n=1 Tax=Alkalihalobacillus sp. LMS39 TaxID=2924032 RepID=UPI001FB2982D|nr:phosphoribosylglycinamide formyltransferase [Alkalihalobacillus sp. LMS39]UOE94484.1 phosphoribosylglycinamide formyltransferase [Alkalihalobacillus sp. LMS39]